MVMALGLGWSWDWMEVGCGEPSEGDMGERVCRR